MKGITNIHVDNFRNGIADHYAAIGWSTPEARFHFWANLKTREIDARTLGSSPTIYKNSHANYREPGYFKTVYLDATAKKNAQIVAHIWSVIERDGLIEKGRAAQAEKDKARERAQLEAARDLATKEIGDHIAWLKKHDFADELHDTLSAALSMDDLDALKDRLP